MRLIRLVSFASLFLIPSIALTACGGEEPLEPILLDASVPDALPPPPDAEPCPNDECDGVCVNFDNAEQTCGNCTTVCNGGEACNGGVCACVPAYVPEGSVGLLGSQITEMIPGAITGFGGFFAGGGTLHALGVGYPINVVLDSEYTLVPPPASGIPSPPFVASGYNVNPQTQEADAAHYATAGTIIFDTACDDAMGDPAGFSGRATGVTFSPVAGLTDPTIDTDGCAPFAPVSFTFAYGTACP